MGIVNRENFVTAPEHAPSKDYSKTYGQTCDPHQSSRIQALFNIAVEEMNLEGEQETVKLASARSLSTVFTSAMEDSSEKAMCEVFVAQLLAQCMSYILQVAYLATVLTYFDSNKKEKVIIDIGDNNKPILVIEDADEADEKIEAERALLSVIMADFDQSDVQLKPRRSRRSNRRQRTSAERKRK